MVRSIWKGDISFGLVTIPVSLVSTEENNDIHFHLLNAKTHARVRYMRVDEGTGKEVPWNQIVKGYEYDKDNYLIVDEEQFEKASPELYKTIDIDEFIDCQEIDSLYYNKPYYLIPEGKNKKSYVLLREALKNTNKAGVSRVMLRTREYLSIIVPHKQALILYLMHFKDEIRTESELNIPSDNLKDYRISAKEITMAESLIKDMSASWKPEKYHNEYRETLQKWLDKQTAALAKKGKKVTKSPVSKEAVVDFVSLLKKSMKHKSRKKTG